MPQGKVSKSGRRKARRSEGRRGKARAKRNPGAVQRARKRAEGLIDPNVHIVVEDPLRVQILSVAIQRLYAPSDFARDVGIPINSAAYHFRKLKEHGFLELVKTEQVRGSTKYLYRATKSGFISEADWGEVSDALRPGVAGAILQDFIGRTTQAIETGTLLSRDSATLYWAPEDLDEIAWQEQYEIVNWAIEATKQLVADTANRRAKGESEGSFHATFAIASFPSPTHEEVKKLRATRGRGGQNGRGNTKTKGSTGKSAGAGRGQSDKA